MHPPVSIVITTYNRAAFLGTAIASILQQTHQDFELLIWDDGSTDGSFELAQTYARRDRRVRVIHTENRGRVAALKAAIAQTTGTYVGWVDSDDWLAPTALEKTIAVLDADSSAGMVYTDYVDVDEQGQTLQLGHRCHMPYSKDRLLVEFMTFHFRLLRRSLYEQVGGIDGSLDFVEDYDLCLRLSEITQIRRVREPLYYYRIHGGNASHLLDLEQTLRSRVVIERALQRRGMAQTHDLEVALPTGRFTLRRKPTLSALRTPPAAPSEQRFLNLRRSLVPLLAAFPVVAGMGTVAQAQIAPAADGTNTIVTPAGNRFDIGGGTLSSDRANLFHSFEQFGLNPGQIANFLANPQLQNILGRVVGNNPSVINGLIQVSGGTPNLFLLNPAGIIFGTNASLNVPGSFTATTANAIGFGNGAWFNAIAANDYVNLTGNPGSFAFSTLAPGAIVNAGSLAVGQGQSITLMGGTIINTGTLSAPNGTITIAAVPGENLVRLSQQGSLLNLEFQPLVASATLASPAPTLPQLLTGGALSNATGLTVNPDGSVQLTRSGVTIPTTAGTAIVSGQVSVANQASTPSPSSSITVVGSKVGLVSANLDASGVNDGGTIRIGGDYQGGNTLPTASQTYISADSTLKADAGQQGNGGRVIIWADKTTQFGGTITARGGATSGDGGFVEVSGKENLQYRGTVDTSAVNGTPGTLLLDPTNIFITAGAGADDAQLADDQILAGDGGDTTFTISANALLTIGLNATAILQATNSITFDPAIGTLNYNPFPKPAALTFQAGGAIATNGVDIIAPRTNITFAANTLSLGNINTSGVAGVFGDAGNITLQATGNITAGDLIGNGYSVGATVSGGAISVTSATGSIAVGNIASTFALGGFGSASGNTVRLETNTNGGNIAFQSIDTRAFANNVPPPLSSGDVVISAKGQVRGIGFVNGFDTIITTGFGTTGTSGRVSITHDGGTANQPFTVGTGAVTANNGNGTTGTITTGAIATGIEITSGIFPFASSPFQSASGNVQITFNNTPPTLNPIAPLPDTTLDQPLSFSVASLGLVPADLNADSPLVIRVAAIAPGAILRINGVNAIPGTIILPDATLQYVPPPGFVGLLSDAFSLTVDDGISASAPRAIALNIRSNVRDRPIDIPNLCVLTTCQVLDPKFDNPSAPKFALERITAEQRFTDAFSVYLGLSETTSKSIDQQKEIAQTIERETGAKPAFIYVSFVPESLTATDVAVLSGTGGSAVSRDRDTDQLEILVVTAAGDVLRRRIPTATRDKVLALAQAFRLEVSDPRKTRTKRYLEMGQQLYSWMIAPVIEPLQFRKITNLVFLMDGGLRSLPVAALHDGQRFLVEDYSIGLMPSISLTDTRFRKIQDFKLLGLGISESTDGQTPLPSVPVEVATLVNQLWSGRSYLNETATLAALKAARQQQPYGIIHLATHADFQPGSIRNSYIQLWNERLRMDQVRQLGWNNPPVELLVLSACSTALGDLDAELGFGGLAVQAGVKTAVATLWAVNDVATTALIARFYGELQSAPIKAEALRQAQIALIKGQISIDDNQILGAKATPILLPEGTLITRDRVLNHPYYWAPFTMIGSPW